MDFNWNMTLCIAAACQDRGKPRVVIASDWKATDSVGTADIQDKLYWITEDIPVLIAGSITRAIELKDTYKQYVEALAAQSSPVQIKQQDLNDHIKEPIKMFKRKLAEEYLSKRFGLNYDAFRTAVSKNEVPESIAIEAFADIAKLDMECELIIVVFTDRQPYIFQIESDGRVENCEDFATIGSGSYIARGVLYQRKHENTVPLGPTVYHIFEAMKLGSIAPDVGEEHTINILYPPGERGKKMGVDTLTPGAERFLHRQFRRFGPKEFKRLPLPSGSLENEY